MLRVIETGDLGSAGDFEAPDEYAVKDYRGELMFKGETHWIFEADSEEELEDIAREKMKLAKKIMGEDEPDGGHFIMLGT